MTYYINQHAISTNKLSSIIYLLMAYSYSPVSNLAQNGLQKKYINMYINAGRIRAVQKWDIIINNNNNNNNIIIIITKQNKTFDNYI